MIQEAIKILIQGKNLTCDESFVAMKSIMNGEATAAQIGSFITALRIKGETIDEITGCAIAMRDKAEPIELEIDYFIDTCGTGGDGANTFNISTAAAFVAAAGGVPVAKHGNRSISSKCGSADVLEALGVNIALTPSQVKKCIEKTKMGFMFAPAFHKSMKYAAGPRRELGIRTIFNILGPLTNPAHAKGQVLGIFDRELTGPVANVLSNLGITNAMVIHGHDGMDEITITGPTKVSELKNGKIIEYEITPEDFGLNRADAYEISGGDPMENANIIKAVFNGAKGPKRDVVVLNAAAALYVGQAAESLKEGVRIAQELIDSGKAAAKLEEVKMVSFMDCPGTEKVQ